ncbi:MAG: DUF6272 family protein [Flavobacteriales bacterium]
MKIDGPYNSWTAEEHGTNVIEEHVVASGSITSRPSMERTLFHLYETLGGAPCLFGYAGGFPDEHTARLIELGAAVLDQQGSRTSERGRLGYVMVEAYQNVVRHRARLAPALEAGVARSHFMLHCGTAGQIVGTLNPVDMDKAKDLQEVLGFLKGRTTTELKGLFRDGIQRTHEPGRRGAGLGLIEMMRRSGATPTWDREDCLEEHTMFALAWSAGGDGASSQGLELLHRQRSLLVDSGCWLSYVGLDTPEVLENLGRMVETEPGQPAGGPAGRNALHRAAGMLRTSGESPTTIAVLLGASAEGPALRAGVLVSEANAGTVLAQIASARSEHRDLEVLSEVMARGTWIQVGIPLNGA